MVRMSALKLVMQHLEMIGHSDCILEMLRTAKSTENLPGEMAPMLSFVILPR